MAREPSLEQLMSQHTEVELRLPAFSRTITSRTSTCASPCTSASPVPPTSRELRELKVELIDRFGLLPEPTKTLMELAAFRASAPRRWGFAGWEMSERGGYLDFYRKPGQPGLSGRLLSEQPRIYKMDGPTRLRFQVPTQDRPCASNWWTACWRISPAMPPLRESMTSQGATCRHNNGPRAPVSLARRHLAPPPSLPRCLGSPSGSTILPPNPSVDTMHWSNPSKTGWMWG